MFIPNREMELEPIFFDRFDIEESSIFDMYRSREYVGGATVSTSELHENTTTLVNIFIEPPYRGEGLARVLFDKTVDCAREEGSEYFEAFVANERSAQLFNTFDEKNLDVLKKDKTTGRYDALPLSVAALVSYLQDFRQRNGQRGDREDDILNTCSLVRAKIL